MRMNTPLNVPIPLIERSGKGKMRRKTERRCEVGTLITGEGEGEGEGDEVGRGGGEADGGNGCVGCRCEGA